MSAIEVDEATQEINRVDASDIETARNLNMDDEMFAPVEEENNEESARMSKNPNTFGAQQHMDMMSIDGNSILEGMDDSIDDDAGDGNTSATVQKLRQKLMRAENENVELNRKLTIINEENEEIKAKNELDEEENGGSMIPHIKVTLIQYLRNVALTDRQNEDLLTIIFGMMDFTPVEI